jgi:hypothetical protein
MTTSVPTSAYIPGVCNINTKEIGRRRLLGWVGVALFIVGLGALVLLGIDRWWRLILFPASFLAASGFLQAKHHFCTGYGGAGKQNATEGNTKALAVVDAAARKLDRQRTRQINVQAAAIGIVPALLSLLLPIGHSL